MSSLESCEPLSLAVRRLRQELGTAYQQRVCPRRLNLLRLRGICPGGKNTTTNMILARSAFL